MNCEQTKELLSSYYDGELGDELAGAVGAHVNHCPVCQAELASFQQLSAAMRCTLTAQPAEGSWQRVAARLEEPSSQPANALESMSTPSIETASPDSATSGTFVRRSTFGGARTAAAAILALAASLLLIVGLRAPHRGLALHDSAQAVSAVNYQDVVALFEQQPQLAMETLSRRYGGREVSAEQAEAMLGYRPIITAELPAHTRLVSTRVLKLPKCRCAGGKCACGPGECNCAACVCERPDGSRFLVFEQCKTQDVTFGDLPFRIAKRDKRDVQFVRSQDRLAASWVKDKRRLTAIGLRDEGEADSLIAALGNETAGHTPL